MMRHGICFLLKSGREEKRSLHVNNNYNFLPHKINHSMSCMCQFVRYANGQCQNRISLFVAYSQILTDIQYCYVTLLMIWKCAFRFIFAKNNCIPASVSILIVLWFLLPHLSFQMHSQRFKRHILVFKQEDKTYNTVLLIVLNSLSYA